jgi:hypothetical protein
MLRHSTGYKLANDGAEYAIVGALSRASELAIDGAIYCASAGSVCEILAGLSALGRESGSDVGFWEESGSNADIAKVT